MHPPLRLPALRAPALRVLLALCPALVAGCGPLVQIGGGSTPPVALYTLSSNPPAAVPAGLVPTDMARAVTVDIPSVPGALQTLRMPVTVSDTEIQYVKAAQWSEQPNRLFQRLLADALVAGGTGVIDQRSSGQAASRRLTGQLVAFGVDVRDGRQVMVRYDATLATPTSLKQRRFERTAPLSDVTGAATAEALNRAANAVAADVAGWVRDAG